MSKIELETITIENCETYSSLRLNSLKDSPDSFGSTYDRESSFSKDEWVSRIIPKEGTVHLLPLMVKYEGVHAGLAFGLVNKQEPKTAHLYQMWVSPNYRGKGLGQSLLKRIVSWAKELQLSYISLGVTTTNVEAISLYKSIGFVAIGKPEPLREGSHLFAQSMRLKLGGNSR